MRIASLVPSLALGALLALVPACGHPDVDLQGEGARRTGAMKPRPRTADDGGVVEVAAANLTRPAPAPKSEPQVAAPARGRGSRSGSKKDSYEVDESAVANAGRIEGTIKLSGQPVIGTIVVDKDLEACGHESHPSERCVFDPETLGLANCVVVIEGIEKGKDWPEALRPKDRLTTIDQKSCQYIPHVMVTREKTQLAVDNSDNALHNIHGYLESMLNTVFNFGSGAGTKQQIVAEAYLAKPGKYIVKCDIHPWMNAYIHAVTNPYFAVTDAKGKFVLEGVPPGEYTVKVWHEGMEETPVVVDNKISSYEYGADWEETVTVTVEAGKAATVELTAPAPGK
ncbi:MAG: carboxypeptidase regulatory-like domain-containing protein [Planctomycetota bacterium]